MKKKHIFIALAVIVILILVFVGLHILNKKKTQLEYAQLQQDYRESVNNYVPDLDMEAYLKEKEKWNLDPSAPVSEYGMINVNGNTYYLGMTMQEVIDFGYPYVEYLDEEDGNGLGSLVLYYDEDDKDAVTPAMINLTFRLKEGGDRLSRDDYELSSFHLNEYSVSYNQQEYYFGKLSHNAEIIYGIKTDMTYQEVMAILEPLGEQAEVTLRNEAGPYMTVHVTMGEHVYVLNFREMRLSEMNMFLEENQATQSPWDYKIRSWFRAVWNS